MAKQKFTKITFNYIIIHKSKEKKGDTRQNRQMNSTEDGTCLESLGIAACICVDIFPP